MQSRRQIYENVSTASGYIRIVAGFVGIAAWVLSTSALLVVVPLGIELEREQMFIQQENEFKLQQQQAQQVWLLSDADLTLWGYVDAPTTVCSHGTKVKKNKKIKNN